MKFDKEKNVCRLTGGIILCPKVFIDPFYLLYSTPVPNRLWE